MTPKEVYDHIIKHMSPEEALMKLLEGTIIDYQHLKFKDPDSVIHPIIVISMATLELGWNIVLKGGEDEMQGMVVGTEDYINSILKK